MFKKFFKLCMDNQHCVQDRGFPVFAGIKQGK
nr:MAG TPA: hypothetical protein [Caudoviricetes sp.]